MMLIAFGKKNVYLAKCQNGCMVVYQESWYLVKKQKQENNSTIVPK